MGLIQLTPAQHRTLQAILEHDRKAEAGEVDFGWTLPVMTNGQAMAARRRCVLRMEHDGLVAGYVHGGWVPTDLGRLHRVSLGKAGRAALQWAADQDWFGGLECATVPATTHGYVLRVLTEGGIITGPYTRKLTEFGQDLVRELQKG